VTDHMSYGDNLLTATGAAMAKEPKSDVPYGTLDLMILRRLKVWVRFTVTALPADRAVAEAQSHSTRAQCYPALLRRSRKVGSRRIGVSARTTAGRDTTQSPRQAGGNCARKK